MANNNFFKVRNGVNVGSAASDPLVANSNKGDVYFNTTFNKLRQFNGTNWANLGSGGGGTGKNYLSDYIPSTHGGTANPGNGDFELGSTDGWSLFNTTISYVNSQTFTVTIASPAVFTTSANHGLKIGQAIVLTTTGALPTGLTTNKSYYVTAIPTATTFKVSADPFLSSEVNTSGSQSGTHTLKFTARPSGSITSGADGFNALSIESTTPMAGLYSMILEAPTAMKIGQGFISDTFYIDAEDKGAVMTATLYYQVVSGADKIRLDGSLSNALSMYIYDVTNSEWIEPSGFNGFLTGSGPQKVTCTFQTRTDSAQYRVAIISLNGSNGAVKFNFDDMFCGPQLKTYGAYVGNTTPYTPLTEGVGTISSNNSYWWREGKYLNISIRFLVGTPTNNPVKVYLPTGLVIDDGHPNLMCFGTGFAATAGSGGFVNTVTVYGVSGDNFLTLQTPGTAIISSGNGSTIFSSGAPLTFTAKIPIKGWGSNMLLSSETDNRPVVAYYKTANSAVSASPSTPVDFSVKIEDTHNAVTTGSSWRFTSPRSSRYQIALRNYYGTSDVVVSMYKNGSLETVIVRSRSTSDSETYSFFIKLNTGEYVDIRPNGSASTSYQVSPDSYEKANWIQIVSVNNPQTIAATERISCSYYCSTNKSASSSTPIDFDTKEWDTHSAVTTGSGWKFTAPASGEYEVNGTGFSTTGTSVIIYKNGSAVKRLGSIAFNNSEGGVFSGSIILKAGEYIDFRVTPSATAQGGSLSSDITSNVSIRRVGIY